MILFNNSKIHEKKNWNQKLGFQAKILDLHPSYRKRNFFFFLRFPGSCNFGCITDFLITIVRLELYSIILKRKAIAD